MYINRGYLKKIVILYRYNQIVKTLVIQVASHTDKSLLIVIHLYLKERKHRTTYLERLKRPSKFVFVFEDSF